MTDTPRPFTRPDGRAIDQLRPITFETGIAPQALGSVLVSFEKTRVICAASIDERVPGWMRAQKVEGGWMTAEYSMLPYSTHDRKQRDISRGKADGRTIEIQRLIGRSLVPFLISKSLPVKPFGSTAMSFRPTAARAPLQSLVLM